MIYRILVSAVFLSALLRPGSGSYAQVKPVDGQQMSDFSLAGFGEKGRKSWDLTGKQADIASEVIKLNDIVGNFYGEKDNLKLTAETGDFDRIKGSLHLEKDVVATTGSGAKLTTNSLDWDRKAQLVTTADPVNLVKDDVVIEGLGAKANTELNKVNLEKDIKVRIDNKPGRGVQAAREKIEISCDGPLEVDYQKNLAVFKNRVKVRTQDGLIESDLMEVYFSPADSRSKRAESELNGSKIERIISRGNVKVTRGDNVSYSETAVYSAAERRIVLTGRPKLIIYSTEGVNAPVGN